MLWVHFIAQCCSEISLCQLLLTHQKEKREPQDDLNDSVTFQPDKNVIVLWETADKGNYFWGHENGPSFH